MSDPSPTVTAILTTYNSEAHVLRALDSVRAQTRPVDQIIVVDDGSTDGTRDLLRDVPDIRLIAQRNAGPGAARNAGFAAAEGTLVAFLDADDMWLPDKTARQIEHLRRHPDHVAVSGGKVWWNEDEDQKRSHPYDPEHRRDLRRHLPHINCVGNPSMVLIRAEALAAVGGFDAGVRWGQDWDLWIRLLAEGEIGFLPEDVIVYSWRPGNHSHSDPEARLDSFFNVSRKGVARLTPPGRRGPAYLRAHGAHTLNRAGLAKARGQRGRTLLLSATALACFPVSRFSETAKLLAWASLGDAWYARVKGWRKGGKS